MDLDKMAPDAGANNLALFSRGEVEQLFSSWGHPRFRAHQVLRWIWKEGVFDFDSMTNLSRDLRTKLKAEYRVAPPKIVFSQKSEDGTIKYLLKMDDGRTVETVWIPRFDQNRVTVCVSSQVGCKMGCTFCLTAQQKVERNLRAGEIAGQILALPNRKEITNVVLMGMGEPFDNYDHLMASLELMNHADSLNIGVRKITVSTSGLVPAIKKFVRDSKCRLAVSLNAPTDEIRSQIMPINRAYPLDVLLGALRDLGREDKIKRGGRSRLTFTFEYILIKNLNDRPEHARELIRRCHGIPCKINLLLYNENPNVPFQRPEESSVEEFRSILSRGGLMNFLRSSRGRDISAACGQLVSEHKRHHEAAPFASASL